MSQRGEAIVLIGFMGSGKSSVGRHLAQRLRCRRYDTDELVVASLGLSIAEIFAQLGEETFRNAETEALKKIPEGRGVIVTGGGIVLRDANVRILRQLGTVVQLTASESVLVERVSRRATRPLLRTENPRATVAELLALRQPFYRAAADFVIDTSTLRHEEVADAVLEKIEQTRHRPG